MDKYINGSKLLEKLYVERNALHTQNEMNTLTFVIALLEGAPTADVKEL